MLEFFNRIFGILVPVAVLLAGGVFAGGLRGRPLGRVGWRRAVTGGGHGGASPVGSLLLALAGTLGVGNIVGVASAIALGGPGAVLWMWVGAILAAFLKYAEVVLAVRHRRARADGSHFGGAPYYFQAVLAPRAPRLAPVAAAGFAVLCLANSLTMGCVIQAGAVAGAMADVFRVSPLAVGVVLALICPLLLRRGRRAVAGLCGVLVPVMTGLFLLLSMAVLVTRRGEVWPALTAVFEDAFTPSAAGGGVVGLINARAMRFGTVRGIISNEAGCGTSPTAHGAADTDSPVEQGMLGIIEVAVDTLILCTVTALAVLCAGVAPEADPLGWVFDCYTLALGGAIFVAPLLAVAIACFGVATLFCWGYYGAEALAYLRRRDGGGEVPVSFALLFGGCCLIGAVAAPALLWSLTDLVTALMTLANLTVLLLARKEVQKETRQYFGSRK